MNETGGDLRHPNIVSRLAEEMGAAIYANMHRADTALRNAINPLKYVPPESLPQSADVDQLSYEPHSFSRVFTGAFYDLIIWTFEENRKTQDGVTALKAARNQVTTILLNAILHAAVSNRFFDSVSRAMLLVDGDMGGKCAAGIRLAFGSRGILTETPLTVIKPLMFKMDGKDAKIYKHKKGTAVRVASNKTMRLTDHIVLALSENKLYNVEVDIPNEHYLEYDESGKLVLERPILKDEILEGTKFFLDYLSNADKVSFEENDDKEFVVRNGRLERNFACCK